MASNSNLGAARAAKQDEFYTRRQDIENELAHYSSHFLDKVVYCNCDDPVTSEFWQFFIRNFMAWGIKKLIATHYETNEQNYSYKLEMEADKNGQFSMYNEPKRMPILCNGDFRSAACIEILKEADIVVTNPPFSLFREYVAQLIEYKKKFLIIGSQNAISYKEIFPLVRDNLIWLGYGFNNGNAYFRINPEDARNYANGVYDANTGFVHFRNCTWFTNLDIPKRHEPLDLRGTYYYGNEEQYPTYDNYDAIEVSKVADIPCDYYGMIGVPITFMNVYCPEQFEILGLSDRDSTLKSKTYTKADSPKYSDLNRRCAIIMPDGTYKATYARLFIRRKKEVQT